LTLKGTFRYTKVQLSRKYSKEENGKVLTREYAAATLLLISKIEKDVQIESDSQWKCFGI